MLIIGIVIGVLLGSIQSVAWGYAGANLLLLYPVIAVPGRLIGMRFLDVVAVVWRTAAVSVGMAVALALLRTVLAQRSPVATLLLLLPLGGIVYAGASVLLNRWSCFEVLRVVEGVAPRFGVYARHLRAVIRL